MKRLILAVAVAILVTPACPSLFAQDGGFGGGFGGDSVDLSGLLGGGRGGDRGGNRDFGGDRGGGRGNFLQAPDPKTMFLDIQATLKAGKTPLEKAQEKPLQALLDSETKALNDQFQTLRNAISGNAPAASGNNQQPNAQAVQTETLTNQKNDDFIDTKLAGFLSPEQVALVKKAKADDKNNSTCLGGLLDRVNPQLQNQGRNNSFNNNNNNASNTTKKSNGQPYCMTAEATASERLEPIRKVLAKGKLPLDKDKEPIAEIFMKSQMKDLGDVLRAGGNGNRGFNQADIAALLGGRGGNNADLAALLGGGGNRGGGNGNINPQQLTNGAVDNVYKKVEASLMPPQAETLKRWQYSQMLDRGGIDSLIAIEALQETPLTDAQAAKVTTAWSDIRNQIQQAARAANKNLSGKEIDNATMNKILDMLEPSQVASYQLAKKYGAQTVPGK